MTQVNVLQKSFSSGEISPQLEARSDVEDYREGLSDSLNVLCTGTGDLIPRPGTEYINMTPGLEARQASKKARLIPFKYSETESYMFEFSEYNLQIYKSGKPLSWTPVAGGDTYETIQSAEYVHEAQYPIVGGSFATENSSFVFSGEGSFAYEAGAGPFTMSEVDGSTIAGLSYVFPFSTGNATVFITNQTLLWVHSVERGIIAQTDGSGDLYKGVSGQANNVIGKSCDIVRLTWHPSFCEGGSAYDPTAYIYALNGTTSRLANNTSTKWTFFTASIKSSVTSTTSALNISDVNYQSFFGSTDLAAGGERTSPIPYLEDELDDIQYASGGDYTFLTHPNHQPIKITRTGLESFKVQNHYTIGGPWRSTPTYPNTYWGGAHHLTGSIATILQGGTGAGATPTISPINDTTYATDVVYLFKSMGTPDIITNADQSNPEADDIIVGRKIRICIPVGKKWWSENQPVSSQTLEDWNTTEKLNTREASNPTGAGATAIIQKNLIALETIQTTQTPDSPAYTWMEGEIEAVLDTVGPVKHANPTRGFRIRITKGANYFRAKPDFRYVAPSTRTKIGRLFEPVMPDQTGGWPKCVAIIDNRLVYAGNQENPTVLAFSAAGNFDDFTPDDYGFNVVNTINTLSDPNTWSVPSNYNAETYDVNSFVYYLQDGIADDIQWLKTTNYGLIAGTSNGMYLSPKLGYNEAYTPFNFDMHLVSEEGCNRVQAEFIDGKIYYINKLGDKLLSMEYVNEADGYRPRVESVMSEHLFTPGIKAMAYTRTPLNVLWLLTENGDLISGVRLDTKDKLAFFKHKVAAASFNTKTYAETTSVAAIPSDTLEFDQLWMANTRALPWKGLGFSLSTNPFGDPSSSAEAKYELNTIERLTQYNFALTDDRDFVGLDCSVHNQSHYNGSTVAAASYGGNRKITEATNYYNDFGGVSLTLKLDDVDGLIQNEDYFITNMCNDLGYLNYKTKNNINNVPSSPTNLISSDAVLNDGKFSAKGFINSDLTSHGIFIQGQFPYVAGKKYERETAFSTGLAFLVASNNFAFFNNGILDLSIFSHNEHGEPSQYPEFGLTSTVSGLYQRESVYPSRVIYARGNSYVHSTSALDSFVLTGTFPFKHYGFVAGFKPEVYWTTLPPRINNQLGEADLSYVFMTSASVHVKNAHQITVKNNSVESTAEEMIDDEYKTTEDFPTAVERRTGVYKATLIQPEEDTRGRVRFENATGYPFRLLEINLRGERATRG